MTPLFKKLNLGEHTTILVIDAPQSFEAELAQLENVKMLRKGSDKTAAGFGIGFAITQSELDRVSTTLIKSTQGDAVIWIAYPKKSSKEYQCEFDRDSGWHKLGEAGFEPVRMVAIDHNWSALRFRRAEHIKSMTRSQTMAISAEGKRRTQ